VTGTVFFLIAAVFGHDDWHSGNVSAGELALTLAGLDEAVVRVSAGVAYVHDPVPDSRDPVELALVERVRAELDPAGVLA